MPVCADPKQTIAYVLEGDRAANVSPAPTFHLKFLTCSEARLVEGLFRKAMQAETPEDQTEQLLDEVIGECVVRTENVAFAGQAVLPTAKPSGYLSTDEIWELARAAVREPHLKESDRKKSSSPSTSAAAACATSAAAAASAAAPSPATASSSSAAPAADAPAAAPSATTSASTS